MLYLSRDERLINRVDVCVCLLCAVNLKGKANLMI